VTCFCRQEGENNDRGRRKISTKNQFRSDPPRDRCRDPGHGACAAVPHADVAGLAVKFLQGIDHIIKFDDATGSWDLP
jgi:hypothetical protein